MITLKSLIKESFTSPTMIKLKSLLCERPTSAHMRSLVRLAQKYKSFEEFESDYCGKNYHGLYWHLTKDPNFRINPTQSPTDLSSLASGGSGEPGLMVTTDIYGWDETFKHTRPYAALIDLSDLTPNVDYRYVGRGFGHEMYIFKPEKARVVKVLPIRVAKKMTDYRYRKGLPQNREELRQIYDFAHQGETHD